MAPNRSNDLRAFRDFADAKLSNAPGDERAATVAAVKEALADMWAGDRGIPAREFLAEMRRKYRLPA